MMSREILYSFLFLWLFFVHCSAENTCPLSSSSSFGSNFPQRPENITLNVCRRGTNACCFSQYDSQIGGGADALTSDIVTKLQFNSSSSCAQILQQLACAQCAFDQQVVFERLGSEDRFIFHVCQDFCSAIYQACGDAVLTSNSRSVFDTYANSTAFCSDILSSSMFFVHLVDRAVERVCWDPSLPPCNISFIQPIYGDCVNGQREVSYYWNPSQDCAGGMFLPSDLLQSCPMSCPDGEYLPMISSTCQPCPTGTTTSNRFCLVNWNQWFQYEEVSIETFCSPSYLDGDPPPPNCTGWQLRGDHLESGIKNLDGVSSTLVINVDLQRDGYVSFLAWVDAEPYYDYLIFYIDGGWVQYIDSRMQKASYNFSLKAGSHSLRWRYIKDSFLSDGSDSAYLWSIVIGGRQWAPDHCVPVQTEPCCQNLTIDTRSPCNRHDIGWNYLPCNNQSQTYKVYFWIKDCNPNSSEAISLPPPEGPFRCVAGCVEGWYKPFGNDTCVPCPAGHYFVPTGSCQECPNGTYSSMEATHQCKACPATTSPNINHTDCEASCLLPVPPLIINGTLVNTTGLFYNLTALGEYATYAYEFETSTTFIINLCKKQTFCYYDATHFLVCLPPSHIIADRYSTDDALSLGRQFKYIPGIEDGRFTVEFIEPLDQYWGCSNGTRVLIDFQCNLFGGQVYPQLMTRNSSSPCVLRFLWSTIYACRPCTDQDFLALEGQCGTSGQTITFIKRTQCVGSKEPIHIECSYVSVTKQQVNIAAIISFVVIVLLVILTVVAIIIWRKKKEFEIKYTQLVQKQEKENASL